MFLFLYGQDTYQSRKKLNEIIEHYKKIHKKGLSLKYFNGESLSFEEFEDEIKQNSIFEEKKLIVLTNVFSEAELKKKFLKNAKNFVNSQDNILFYEEAEISPKDAFFCFLKKEAKTQEFKPLEGQKLRNWIKKEFEKYKVNIELSVIEKLINYVGNDLWQLNNEIRKLVNYKSGSAFAEVSKEKQEIELKDVELLVKPKIETDIFKTINAIALKDKKQAIFLIHKHLEKGDNPFYLFSMINFQFRNLLIIKELIEKRLPYYSIFKISNLHPFVVKKSWDQASKFTFQELKKIYQKIFQIDFSIKTGKLEAKTALDLFIAET